MVLLCSKKQKCLEELGEYWQKRYNVYDSREDEGADMDSQDTTDHRVQLMDPNVLVYMKKRSVKVGC